VPIRVWHEVEPEWGGKTARANAPRRMCYGAGCGSTRRYRMLTFIRIFTGS
jgi:hypothetical protein